ncbi:gibberellin-regulated protein 9 [Dorcoceras hygrometricum]|uniref:Gibberellin-regulated protein 9 n=1 Tax=Dorcoceras hygrometricum TaxID=472368 RepID=A0A2Z7BFG4_9LAMI|nr:gibberellin-regulated protein 9 [Dorcoceras hygrometricum]
MMKLLCLLLIATLFIQGGLLEATSVTDASAQGGNLGGLLDQKYRINCPAACSRRCSKSSRRKICFRSCTGCCARCNCVPPGTSGNTHLCPCYARIRTRGNRLKCP